jgi:hypothetical protein
MPASVVEFDEAEVAVDVADGIVEVEKVVGCTVDVIVCIRAKVMHN